MTDRPMATIRDVAERAGVSRQTVSRVLNHNNYVSDDARKQVLAAISDLDYRPNPAAQALGRIGSRKVMPKNSDTSI